MTLARSTITNARFWGALALLLIAAHRVATTHASPAADTYFDRVRRAVDAAPHRWHGWVGQDEHVAVQARTLLAPNAMISRRFTNIETGQAASFVLVHCRDAHDMAGHFPLRCYPANGWSVVGNEPAAWQLDGLDVPGRVYQFSRTTSPAGGGRAERITVANFMLRPDGRVLPDMNALAASVVGAGGQGTGAAQVQVQFDGDVPAATLDQAVRELLTANRAAIDAVLSPVNQ